MCLFVKGKIQVAKEPITVYKIITVENKSKYQHFRYTPDTLYRLRKALKTKRLYGDRVIEPGFHAYRTLGYTKRALSYTKRALTGYIVRSWSREKIVEFTIPKGAKYYLGHNNDIVSTSIRSGSLVPIK